VIARVALSSKLIISLIIDSNLKSKSINFSLWTCSTQWSLIEHRKYDKCAFSDDSFDVEHEWLDKIRERGLMMEGDLGMRRGG